MKRLLLFSLTSLTMLGCGDDEIDCGRFTDTFHATDIRIGGDCPTGSSDDAPYTIQSFDNGDGTVELVFEGIGGSCTAAVSECDLITTCVSPPTGTPNVSFAIDYTVQPDGLTGEVTVTIAPGVRTDAPRGCTARYRTTATR